MMFGLRFGFGVIGLKGGKMRGVKAVAATDQTNTTTTLADTALTFNVAPGETWFFQLTAFITLDATGSVGFEIATPAGAAGNVDFHFDGVNAAFGMLAINTLKNSTPDSAGVTIPVTISGSVVNGSTAGAVRLQIARFGGTSVVLKAGSGLVAFK
jgi:hypothetical protein